MKGCKNTSLFMTNKNEYVQITFCQAGSRSFNLWPNFSSKTSATHLSCHQKQLLPFFENSFIQGRLVALILASNLTLMTQVSRPHHYLRSSFTMSPIAQMAFQLYFLKNLPLNLPIFLKNCFSLPTLLIYIIPPGN